MDGTFMMILHQHELNWIYQELRHNFHREEYGEKYKSNVDGGIILKEPSGKIHPLIFFL